MSCPSFTHSLTNAWLRIGQSRCGVPLESGPCSQIFELLVDNSEVPVQVLPSFATLINYIESTCFRLRAVCWTSLDVLFFHLVEDFFNFFLFLCFEGGFFAILHGLHESHAFPSLLYKDNPLTIQHLSLSSF